MNTGMAAPDKINSENLKLRVSNCFNPVDGTFTGPEEVRVKVLKRYADEHRIPVGEIARIATDYLLNQKYPDKHIRKQVERVRDCFTPGQGLNDKKTGKDPGSMNMQTGSNDIGGISYTDRRAT